MNLMRAMAIFLTLVASCSVLGQRNAQKPSGTHYSAAFIKNDKLIVFPFDKSELSIDLPDTLGGMTFSAGGRIIYGFVGPPTGGSRSLAAVTISPSGVRPLPGSNGFENVNSLTVDAAGDKAIISATYSHNGVSECGIFELDVTRGKVEKIINNLSTGCDYLSAWTHLSVSPDGGRVVGTASKGQIGVVNLKERRIEKLWPGTAASWSPDGKWIAALSFTDPMKIELMSASDLSLQRGLGDETTIQLQWSPDSRYLLVFDYGLCGLSTGYRGTLGTLDIETGQRRQIENSKCRVDLASTGWVSDDVLK